MPQLDQFTYLTQYFWLCLSFFSFYVLLCSSGLPKISRILKLRSLLSTNSVTVLGTPPSDSLVSKSLASGANYLQSSISSASKWCNDCVHNLNETQLLVLNRNFLSSIGEIGVSQVMKKNTYEQLAHSDFALSKMFLLRIKTKNKKS
uniref:H(+)-transporting two-sector ATPase n=1 Tax=Chaetosphaeridium globosum TaxID=96477 RepID=Q8M1D7_CHAGL|nr:ATP synthase F0 subunit 8 [Chaetosphaeridium globosum]AAM96598.1 ATP synthase F0 subunit 8 [Chaetosphaeridium globosum]